MRLTWRDAVSTTLVAAGLLLALSVTQSWGWLGLSGVRAGIIVLGVAGFGACLVSAPTERFYRSDPFGLLLLGVLILALAFTIIGGLIFADMSYLVALMLVVVMLWALATLRHAIEGINPASHHPVAG